MSDRRDETSAGPDDARDLAAGYALRSLSAEERERYEDLLKRSADARAEASEFAEVATSLDAAPPQADPPADLKARLIARIAVTPQAPWAATAGATEETGATIVPHSSVAPTPAVSNAESVERSVSGVASAERKARRRWYVRPAAMVAAATTAVVLFAGGAAVGFALAPHPASSTQADVLASITSAPDARRSTAKVAGGGTATLVWSASLGKSAMIVDGVGAPPPGSTYQLWYMHDGHATSAGLMAGQWQVLSGALRSGDVVGLTVEPSGGSKQPTTKPVVTIVS